ncbi:MAG: HEPN domain-containing protein [Candidatus Woesearchaeota archaeon]
MEKSKNPIIEELFKKRLLRSIPVDIEKSKKSIELSEDRLKKAEKALELNFFDYVILESYSAMFHSARALLYKEGIQEKSHYAIYIYLKETYSNKIPINIINLLNIHRTERHETIYGLEYKPTKEDAKTAYDDAVLFVNEIKKYLK